ncbi:hypothetical protein MRX96_033330 [Rhipicephalus microplus]
MRNKSNLNRGASRKPPYTQRGEDAERGGRSTSNAPHRDLFKGGQGYVVATAGEAYIASCWNDASLKLPPPMYPSRKRVSARFIFHRFRSRPRAAASGKKSSLGEGSQLAAGWKKRHANPFSAIPFEIGERASVAVLSDCSKSTRSLVY